MAGATAFCDGGQCVTQCVSSSHTVCEYACVNLNSDTANCGHCGNACPAAATCVSGACVCPTSTPTACLGQCVNTNTNRANCSTCGHGCIASCLGRDLPTRHAHPHELDCEWGLRHRCHRLDVAAAYCQPRHDLVPQERGGVQDLGGPARDLRNLELGGHLFSVCADDAGRHLRLRWMGAGAVGWRSECRRRPDTRLAHRRRLLPGTNVLSAYVALASSGAWVHVGVFGERAGFRCRRAP